MRRRWWARARWIVTAILLALGTAGVINQRHQLGEAWSLLGSIDWRWLSIALAAQGASLVAFAALQRALLSAGGSSLGLGYVLRLTVASNAVSMSLPGGPAWAAGWTFRILQRRAVPRMVAGWTVLAAGALVSFVLYLTLTAGVVVTGGHGPFADLRWILVGLACIPFVVALMRNRMRGVVEDWIDQDSRAPAAINARTSKWRRRARGIRDSWQTVRPGSSTWAASFRLAAAKRVLDYVCLVTVIRAIDGSVSWSGVLVAYSISQIAIALPLLPGGLGLTEGSLVVLLGAYGLPTSPAVAAVLLYRALSFWGMVPLGWISWVSLELKEAAGRQRQSQGANGSARRSEVDPASRPAGQMATARRPRHCRNRGRS